VLYRLFEKNDGKGMHTNEKQLKGRQKKEKGDNKIGGDQ
jgi:hypothetical protein